MAGETEDKPSAFTVDSLHHLMNIRFAEKDRRDEQRFEAQQLALRDALIAQEKAVNAALMAAQQAVTKAEIAAEKRFDSVNEFRAQLADQTATLMPRNEAMVLINGIAERTNKLEAAHDIDSGRGRGLGDAWGYLVAAVGLAAAVIGIIIATR